MRIKLITLTAVGALSLGNALFAQDPGMENGGPPRGSRGRGHDPLERMMQSLDLTADQKAKIQPVLDEARPQMEQIRREAMQKAKAVMEEAKAKIRPMLTADQQKKLDEAHNEMRRPRRGNGGDAGDDDNG